MVYEVTSQYICAGEPYDIKALVIAYNLLSAQAQLDWLVQNKNCMCPECIVEYEVSYSTFMTLPQGMPTYTMCVKK